MKLEVLGLDVSLNEDYLLDLESNNVKYDDYKRKNIKEMENLLFNPPITDKNEAAYDFYKSLCNKNDDRIFKQYGLRFDVTVIMPGTIGSEFKKTSGHFHNYYNREKYGHPELYQVISGDALFIVQHVNDFKTNPKMSIKELILIQAKAGESVLVPPNYGHATVNIGTGPMVFANLVYNEGTNYYDSVQDSKGMAVYILQDEDEKYKYLKNTNYIFNDEPIKKTSTDCRRLNIIQGQSIYKAFIKDPDSFNYLIEPNGYEDLFLKTLIDGGEI